MQRIDRAAIQTIGIPRLLLMEHAGLAVARAVRSLYAETDNAILVCCGMGHNGGDGLCAARHLAQWGYRPRIMLAGSTAHLKDEPAVYANILRALGVPLVEIRSPDEAKPQQLFANVGVLIDALLGIGLRGSVKPLQTRLIELMNRSGLPIVSVDVPSGLDADTGLPQGIIVKAAVTVTFGLPKQGLFRGEGPDHAGDVIVDDIGIPLSLLAPTGFSDAHG
jgi:NAD(P)H-hydrate epimerase